MQGLAPLDWALLGGYLVLVVVIGAWANRRQRTTEDYTLGGRTMRWWAIGVSLIATSFSSVALIDGTGFGFTRGMAYLQLQIGDLLAIALACALFIPFFSGLGLTTAYGYLERRFGPRVRWVASALFVAQTLLRTGVLVYGPATAISVAMGLDLDAAILVAGAAAILYSAAGGITAVVWTDLVQFGIVVAGVAASVVIVAGDVPGGFAAVLDGAREAGTLDLTDWSPALDQPFTVLWSVVAYGTLAASVAGTNQQAVQRYLSCRSAREASRAAFLGWGMGLVAVALTLFLGVCLAQWAALAPDAAAFASDVARDGGDSALPAFIVHRLPPGLSGLLVAAVFAASMSSMDSAIHSMSTAVLVDFVRPLRRRPLAEATELRLARVLTVVFGIAATALGLVAARAETQMVDTLIRWLGYFAGPLLGVFLLGVLSRTANEAGALVGLVCGAGLVALAVGRDLPAEWGFHSLWLAPVACAVTWSAGVAASGVAAPPSDERLAGMTWFTRRPRP